ncbi:MAG: regulatory iron-sulfur-containing complex subunit RicT [Nitrospinota bacterium]|nr:regulatory iron-sulfur-containing complex subunit RicT [Nitrospinota bacterium]
MSDTYINPQGMTGPGADAEADLSSPAEPVKSLDFVVKVLLHAGGKMSDYYWNGVTLHVGDSCVVLDNGHAEYGSVALTRRPYLPSCSKKAPMGKVLRKATEADIAMAGRLADKEKSALEFCREKVIDHGLKMNISRVSYSFDEKKALFYFTADTRVDFRELVKELNSFTRIKVELRQVGVRDKAKLQGGCGPCGSELCCSGFLPEFAPVSIRMAKNQSLALSPEKISGVCGRLLCCLSYENDVYTELQKKSPKMGKLVDTPDGKRGRVCQLNLLMDRLSVGFEDGTRTEYDIDHLSGALRERRPDTQPASAGAFMDPPLVERKEQRSSRRSDPRQRPKERPRGGGRPQGGRNTEKPQDKNRKRQNVPQKPTVSAEGAKDGKAPDEVKKQTGGLAQPRRRRRGRRRPAK